MGFGKGTAGVVNNGSVTALTDVIQKPAYQRRLPHPDGAMHQEVQHFCHPDHMQITHPKVGQFTVFTQQFIDFCRLVRQLHAGNVFIFAFFPPDIRDKPGHRQEHHQAEDATGTGRPLQFTQTLIAHCLHVRVGINLW